MFEDPSDPNYVYAEAQGGSIGRESTCAPHETRDIQPKLGAADLKRYTKLRFNWNTPIALSPHEPGTVYIGSQFLLRSRDHGQTWDRISPDLTTNDPQKQKQEQSGGVTVDNSVGRDAHDDLLHQRVAASGGAHLGRNRRRQLAGDPRRRRALGQCDRQRAGDAEELLGELGPGKLVRRRHRLCRVRPAYLRRHARPTST